MRPNSPSPRDNVGTVSIAAVPGGLAAFAFRSTPTPGLVWRRSLEVSRERQTSNSLRRHSLLNSMGFT